MTPPRRALPLALMRWVVGLLIAAPLLWTAKASLEPLDRLFHSPLPAPQPGSAVDPDAASGPQWSNYREALTRLPMGRFLLNSAVITLSSVVGAVISASMVAFGLAWLPLRGRRALLLTVLATMALPVQVLLVPQFLIFRELGWHNTYKPLIVPSWLGGSAFFILLFYQFFRGVPRAFVDAARIDGATDWDVYWRVMLPLSRPVLGAVAALAAVAHWQAFLSPLVYLSDYERYPVSVGLRMFQTVEGNWLNHMLAASITAMLVPLLVLFVAQRFLMRGLIAETRR